MESKEEGGRRGKNNAGLSRLNAILRLRSVELQLFFFF